MTEPTVSPAEIPTALTWLGVIGAAIWAGWKFIDAKIEKIYTKIDSKADAADLADAELRAREMAASNSRHIEKLYSNAEADRKQMRDLHDQQMVAQNTSLQLILSAINGKG